MPQNDSSLQSGAQSRRRTRAADAFASFLSSVACPPVLAAAMMAITASIVDTAQAWRYALLYVSLAIATPIAYLGWLVHRGTVSDLDVKVRAERWRPLLAAQLGMAIALVLFLVRGAPPLMIGLAGGMLVYTSAAFFITLYWKISMHSAAAAALTALAVVQFGPHAYPLAAGVPLMAWARIRLRRHTLAQTIAGALLGSGVLVVALTRFALP
jgi:membrane-associated phospholipid phosphatase